MHQEQSELFYSGVCHGHPDKTSREWIILVRMLCSQYLVENKPLLSILMNLKRFFWGCHVGTGTPHRVTFFLLHFPFHTNNNRVFFFYSDNNNSNPHLNYRAILQILFQISHVVLLKLRLLLTEF